MELFMSYNVCNRVLPAEQSLYFYLSDVESPSQYQLRAAFRTLIRPQRSQSLIQ